MRERCPEATWSDPNEAYCCGLCEDGTVCLLDHDEECPEYEDWLGSEYEGWIDEDLMIGRGK